MKYMQDFICRGSARPKGPRYEARKANSVGEIFGKGQPASSQQLGVWGRCKFFSEVRVGASGVPIQVASGAYAPPSAKYIIFLVCDLSECMYVCMEIYAQKTYRYVCQVIQARVV